MACTDSLRDRGKNCCSLHYAKDLYKLTLESDLFSVVFENLNSNDLI